MENYRWSEENLKTVILNSINKSDVLNNLGLKPFTGNYDTLNRYIKIYKISIDHFVKNGYKRNHKPINKISINDILTSGSTYTDTTKLKNRLYKEGLKQPICEKCEQDEWWNGEKMSLILDHINGVRDDNRLENLRIVCPNCNATLPTHCGKNKKSKSSAIYKKTGKYCKCGKKLKSNNVTGFCKKCLYNKNYCHCGKQITDKSKKCTNCHNNNNRKIVNRPPYEQLISEIKELGYCGTGRKYGVSDNAIRKWRKYHEKIIIM